MANLIVVALFAFWLTLSVVSQIWSPRSLLRRDVLRLVPGWKFFRREVPELFDFRLSFRDVSTSGKMSDWSCIVSSSERRFILDGLWHPKRHLAKWTGAVAEQVYRGRDAFERSWTYAAILRHLDTVPREPGFRERQIFISMDRDLDENQVAEISYKSAIPTPTDKPH